MYQPTPFVQRIDHLQIFKKQKSQGQNLDFFLYKNLFVKILNYVHFEEFFLA